VGAVSIGTRGRGTTANQTAWRRKHGAPSAPLTQRELPVERWEWFVYIVRTKLAKKTEIDRRLVLAVFIGFWTLVTLIDFDFSSAPTPTAVSKDRIKQSQLIPALTLNQIQQEESSVEIAGTFQNTNPTGPVHMVMVTWQVISCDKRWKSLTIKYGERILEGCTQVCSKQISTDADVGPGQSGDFHAEIPCPDDHNQNMIRKVRWNVEGAYRWE